MSTTYRIHGLTIASDTALALPPGEAGAAPDLTFRIDLRPPAIEHAQHRRADDPDDPWALEHWVDGRLVVEFPEWATYEVTSDTATLLADETEDADLLEHLLLDHVIPRMVALRGELMLHAAGVVGPQGSALLFLGRTGTGKSSLATALAARGLPLLDDDGIRVATIDGALRAMPGTPAVRLLPDAAAALIGTVPPGRPISDDSPKRRFDVSGLLSVAAVPVPVGAVHVLERTTGDPSLERLSLPEAVAAVAEHGFHVAADPDAITRHVFERATALAAAAPVLRLRCPEGLGRLDEVAELLHGALDGPARFPT